MEPGNKDFIYCQGSRSVLKSKCSLLGSFSKLLWAHTGICLRAMCAVHEHLFHNEFVIMCQPMVSVHLHNRFPLALHPHADLYAPPKSAMKDWKFIDFSDIIATSTNKTRHKLGPLCHHLLLHTYTCATCS